MLALSGLDSWARKTQSAGAVSLVPLLLGSVALVCSLLLWSSNASAAQVVFAWDDPNNSPAQVGGYNLYYWQPEWDMPVKVNVGTTNPYTLRDLEAGQTYTFAVTAYDVNNSRESVFSNELSMTFPDAVPVASFSATPTGGTAPLTVVFTDSSTGSITSWTWDFGDGTTSAAQHPNHTYTAAGTYTVQLTVQGPDGSDADTTSITVSPQIMDLVVAYSFNEGSGTTVVDAAGSANNGTIFGATRITQGKFGRTLSFDGVNDVVRLQDSADLDLTTGMTLEAWVYPTVAPSGWKTIIHKEVDAYFLHAGSDRNTPAAGGTFNGVCCQVVYAPAPLAVRRWTHLAVTYNGTRLRLYINGAQVASRPVSGALETNTSPLSIGGNSPAGEYFQGRIDEVRIYNRALTASEIQRDMNTPVAPPL